MQVIVWTLVFFRSAASTNFWLHGYSQGHSWHLTVFHVSENRLSSQAKWPSVALNCRKRDRGNHQTGYFESNLAWITPLKYFVELVPFILQKTNWSTSNILRYTDVWILVILIFLTVLTDSQHYLNLRFFASRP